MSSLHDRDQNAAASLLAILGRAILASRYLLMVFFFAWWPASPSTAVRFLSKLWSLAGDLLTMPEEDVLIAVLHLVDSALIASLVMIVVLSSYDSLVDRLAGDAEEEDMRWVGRTDYANLKLKVATAIVAISSIHLLQGVPEGGELQPGGGDVAHGHPRLFVLGALLLGLLDRHHPPRQGGENESV
jgi:uncharacterized protein (TIGR00645 family)